MMPQNPIQNAFPETHTILQETLSRIDSQKHLYVIFIIARSGSTWLTEQAGMSGELGIPQEFLNEDFISDTQSALGCDPPQKLGIKNINTYLQYVSENYCGFNDTFGIQVSRWQTAWICELLESRKIVWSHFVPMYLRRKNLVAQAISLSRSAQSGIFHSYQTTENSNKSKYEKTQYDPDDIYKWCEYLVENEIWFETLFAQNNVQPHRFTYEDMLTNMPNVLTWIRNTITKSTDSPPLSTHPGTIRIMRSNQNTEWEKRFRAEKMHCLQEVEKNRPAF